MPSGSRLPRGQAVGAENAGPLSGPSCEIMPLMIVYLCLLPALLRATVRDRSDLVAENLLLRRQLVVLTRHTRKRPRLRAHDRLFWLLARLVRRDWRWHLVLVRPETVVRWLWG